MSEVEDQPRGGSPDTNRTLTILEHLAFSPEADGYASKIEEEQDEIGCIAVPLFGADSQVAGALGVTGFAKDMTSKRSDTIVNELKQLATDLRWQLGGVAIRTR